MREVRLILGLARREAVQRIRSRAFRVSTVIILLAAVGAVALPSIFAPALGGPTEYTIGVVGEPPAGFAEMLEAHSTPDQTIELIPFSDRRAGEEALSDDLDVLVVDGRNLLWEGQTDFQLEALIRRSLNDAQLRERAEEAGVSQEVLARLLEPAEVTSRSVDGPDAMTERGPQALVATAGMVLLFMAVVFYGSYILLSVVEEKQNRIVEVLLAHVEPRDLLAGKVIGYGMLGLGQIAAVALIVGVGLSITDAVEVPPGVYGAIGGLLIWFLLGFTFYSIAYASLGSLVSRTEDAQSAVGPLTIVLLAAYFASFAVIENPDGLLATLGSFFPPTIPLMMPVRMALTDVAIWEVTLAIAIEIAAIVGLVRLGGRLYRGAVMHIGRKLSIREAWRATG